MENVSDVQIAKVVLEWPATTRFRHFSDGLILNQQKAIKQKSILYTVYNQLCTYSKYRSKLSIEENRHAKA